MLTECVGLLTARMCLHCLATGLIFFWPSFVCLPDHRVYVQSMFRYLLHYVLTKSWVFARSQSVGVIIKALLLTGLIFSDQRFAFFLLTGRTCHQFFSTNLIHANRVYLPVDSSYVLSTLGYWLCADRVPVFSCCQNSVRTVNLFATTSTHANRAYWPDHR